MTGSGSKEVLKQNDSNLGIDSGLTLILALFEVEPDGFASTLFSWLQLLHIWYFGQKIWTF